MGLLTVTDLSEVSRRFGQRERLREITDLVEKLRRVGGMRPGLRSYVCLSLSVLPRFENRIVEDSDTPNTKIIYVAQS
jgi:hypothetical protein